MKALMSTAASRAWLGVALVGFVVVVLVLALSLIPRLGAGQHVIDAAEPAFTDERVAGTGASMSLVSEYVDIADPLLTARGGASKEVASLIGLMRRKLDVSSAQARKILRREAPYIEALTRALPLDGIAGEIPRLTSYLASMLTMSEEQLAATLERSFPRISQMLTALPNVADGWYDVPGVEGLTRLTGDKPVRTVPGLRKYYRDDVLPLMVEHRKDLQDLAGAGGIGYIGYLLLVVGLALFAYGLLQARRGATSPPGRRSWSVVVGVGVVLVLLVVVAQYFPRLGGGQRLIDDFEPVFAQERVKGAATGIETVHEAVLFGDPIATPRGAAADETPQLFSFVADRTGRSSREVHAALRRRVPQTVALLDAIPLTRVADEVPQLVSYLTRALRMPRGELVALLRKRTPALAQALLTLPAVTAGWNAIPGTERMTRADGFTPVRTMTEFDDYLRQDLVPVLVDEREDFDSLASTWPPVDRLAPLLLVAGLLVMLYGGVMMRLVARRPR
jgi:hypothetical protein